MRLFIALLILFIGFLPLSYGQQLGKVSYYSSKLQGRRMSNGERYNASEFVAAHRKYDFGTILKVTNLANDIFVIVRVTDRGPFHRDRIIDVSYAAAKKIGLIATGYAQVKVEEAEELRYLLFPETLLRLETPNNFVDIPMTLSATIPMNKEK